MSLMIISDQVIIHSLRDYSGNKLVPEKGILGAVKGFIVELQFQALHYVFWNG